MALQTLCNYRVPKCYNFTLYFHFFPGFVSDFTGGGVRGNSGRCGHDESGKTHPSCGLRQEMKIHWDFWGATIITLQEIQ